MNAKEKIESQVKRDLCIKNEYQFNFDERYYIDEIVSSETCKLELLDALVSIHERMQNCIVLGLSAHEAYDSFYQELSNDAIKKATS
jgi:hypothetical protein